MAWRIFSASALVRTGALLDAFNGRIGHALQVFLALRVGNLPRHDLGPEDPAHINFQRHSTNSTLLTGLNGSGSGEFQPAPLMSHWSF